LKALKGETLSSDQKNSFFLPNLNLSKNEVLQAMNNIYSELMKDDPLYKRALVVYRAKIISETNSPVDKIKKLRGLRKALLEDESTLDLSDAKIKLEFI
jgi:hypothetical protein